MQLGTEQHRDTLLEQRSGHQTQLCSSADSTSSLTGTRFRSAVSFSAERCRYNCKGTWGLKQVQFKTPPSLQTQHHRTADRKMTPVSFWSLQQQIRVKQNTFQTLTGFQSLKSAGVLKVYHVMGVNGWISWNQFKTCPGYIS